MLPLNPDNQSEKISVDKLLVVRGDSILSDSSIYWPENGHWPIFNLKSDEDEKADEDKKLEQAKADKAAESMRFKKAAKIIAGLESKKHIKIKLIHQLMLDATYSAISRYMQKESIPSHYSKIVKSHNCIDVLIKGFFYMVCKMKYSSSLDLEVAQLYETIKKNDARLIVYDRVGLIQKFIHSEVDKFYGEGSSDKIPANHMRLLLSVSRLHLNLSDLSSKDNSYSIYMNELSTSTANYEYFNPRATEVQLGKQFIPRWSVRHIKPLSYFYSRRNRQKISDIYNIDEALPLETYSQAALEIYATP